MRRRLLLAMLLFGAPLPVVVACTGLLGIHELPLREAESDGALTPPPLAGDGGDCDARSPTFCGKLCPKPDFCDDFEGEGPAFERWAGSFGLPNQLVSLEGGISLLTDDRNGQVLFAESHSAMNSPAISVLATEVAAPKGMTPRGVVMRMDAKLGALSFDAPEAGYRDRYFYYFAFADPSRNEGIAVVLYQRDDGALDVVLQQRTISARGKQVDLVKLLRVDNVSLLQNWFGFELITATGAVLREKKIPCTLVDPNGDPISDASDVDGAPPDGLLLVARIASASRCAPIRDELATADWLGKLTIVVGSTVADFGTGGGRLDNIAATYIW